MTRTKTLPIPRTRNLLALGALSSALLALCGAHPAHAQLTLEVLNSNVTPGGSGSFDVDLHDAGGSFGVAAFSFELGVGAGSGITFTDVNTNTAGASYIYGTLQAPPFSFDTFPTTDVIAEDIDFNSPGFVTLNSGDTVGLGHLTFSSAAGTPLGPVTVTVEDPGGGTSLSDTNGDAIAFTPQNGAITVGSAGAAPEPTSLCIFGLGGLIFAARRRRSKSGR